jgi:hypothetical protein
MRRRNNGLGNRAAQGYRSAYNTAQEYPGTIAAIIVGAGITAFLLWAARRAGGWSNLGNEAAERARIGFDYARDGYGRAREAIGERVSRFKDEREDLTQQ